MKLSSTFKMIGSAATLAGIAFGLYALHVSLSSHNKSALPEAASPTVMAVEVATPQMRWLPSEVLANGPVTAKNTASCGSDVGPARVLSVDVRVGDSVRRGQVLARLDSQQFDLALESAKAAWAQSKAALVSAQDTATRDAELVKYHAVSAQANAAAQAQLKQAQAAVEAAKAQVGNARLQVARTVVRSPLDGIVATRTVQPGQVVSAGTVFFTVVSNPTLEWQAQLTASQLKPLKVGDSVKVQLASGAFAAGKLARISPVLDSTTQMGTAYVDFTSSAAKPGELTSGVFTLPAQQALTVPQTAVVHDGSGAFVFVVEGKGQVRQVNVTPGRQDQGFVAVQGVPPEAKVVTLGAGLLHDGDTVKVVSKGAL